MNKKNEINSLTDKIETIKTKQSNNKKEIINSIKYYLLLFIFVEIISYILGNNINPLINSIFGEVKLLSLINYSLMIIATPLISLNTIANIIENIKLKKEEIKTNKQINNLNITKEKNKSAPLSCANKKENTISQESENKLIFHYNCDKQTNNYYSYSGLKSPQTNNPTLVKKRTKK